MLQRFGGKESAGKGQMVDRRDAVEFEGQTDSLDYHGVVLEFVWPVEWEGTPRGSIRGTGLRFL